MNKGIILRTTVHNILCDIRKFNKNLDESYLKNKVSDLKNSDIAFINNVCLNSMRYFFHSKKILLLYIKKKPKFHEEILLCTAIVQIVFLNFKEYAVINSSVDIAKKLNIYHGLVNACLRKISKDKSELKNTVINFRDLPVWFRMQAKNLSSSHKNKFIDGFYKEPDLHLVFKKEKDLLSFEKDIEKTSTKSGFLKNRVKIKDIPSYKKGVWWVQDYSSSYSLKHIDENVIDKKNLDMCAAPGGKSFQILAKGKDIVLNDISKKRIERLKVNLDRLSFDAKIINYDFINLKESTKYDFIIVDAPCSSIGTIRKNPEILYKEKGPDFNTLVSIQRKMLEKASSILNYKGVILYMVCSFFKNETFKQIDDFLLDNKNFSLQKFFKEDKEGQEMKLLRNDFMFTLPAELKSYNIDGYFAVYLKKNKIK